MKANEESAVYSNIHMLEGHSFKIRQKESM